MLTPSASKGADLDQACMHLIRVQGGFMVQANVGRCKVAPGACQLPVILPYPQWRGDARERLTNVRRHECFYD